MHAYRRTMIKNTLMILYINSVIILLLSVTLVSKDAWGVSDSFGQTLDRSYTVGEKVMDLIPTPEDAHEFSSELSSLYSQDNPP